MRKLLLKQKPRKTRKKQLLRKTRKKQKPRSNLGIGLIGGLWPSDNLKKAGVSLPFL
jgi:hypothetical protein